MVTVVLVSGKVASCLLDLLLIPISNLTSEQCETVTECVQNVEISTIDLHWRHFYIIFINTLDVDLQAH